MSRTSNGGQNHAPALSKELKEIAYRELGETPEIKRAALEQLRKLLSAGWNTDICSLSDLLRVCAVHMEYFLLDQEVQIKGMIVVFDMKGLGLHHIPYFTPSFVRRVVILLQDCFPMRMKAVYVINNPVLFDMMFTIAKTVLKSKLIQRVQLLGYNVEKIRSLIPDDLVPEANGGTLESYDYDKTERELHSRADFFRDMGDFGYRDALKRPS